MLSIRRSLIKLGFALLVIVGTISAAAAPAVADVSSTPGLVTVHGPHGENAGWASLDYLKAHPGAIPGVKVTPTSGLQPYSASGCNLNVCIDIVGASTTVTSWSTTAYGNTGCANAYFAWHEGYYVGPTVCPNGLQPGVYYDTTGPTGYFPNGDQLCNYWYNGPAGHPCEYIIA